MHFVDKQVVEGLLQAKSLNINTLITTVGSGTLGLTSDSEAHHVFKGSIAGQIVKMPDCTTFPQPGQLYMFWNDSTQNVTVQDNANTTLFLLQAGQRAFLKCTDIVSAAGAWSYVVFDKTPQSSTQFTCTYPGTGLAVNYTAGIARFDGTTYDIPAGTVTLPASTTNGWIYVDLDGVVKATASMPNGCIPLYKFTTSATAVTSLLDQREDLESNEIWGVVADISKITSANVASAGVLEKGARADHVHESTLPLYKSGSIPAGNFVGNPKTATVTFPTAMPDVNYSVSVSGGDGRSWIVTNKTVAGFVINSQANQALTASVDWKATAHGESK